jgi:nickel superoxide dismutase
MKNIISFIRNPLRIENVYAHCDVPCGIYDPHLAQVSAFTVLRMMNLIAQLDKNAPDYTHKYARYTAVKEEHAEKTKHEVRIIWGDFVKPEHLEKYKDLNSLVFNIMKKGSTARQGIDEAAAKTLVDDVNKFAQIFWEIKGVKTTKITAPYPTGGEMVVPTN